MEGVKRGKLGNKTLNHREQTAGFQRAEEWGDG